MIIDEADYIAHYGTLHKSGRYPWGSGDDPHQGDMTFLERVDKLHKGGMAEADIAKGFGMSTTQLRAAKSNARAEAKQAKLTRAQRLRDHGHSPSEIGRRMGLNESSVRDLLAPATKRKLDILNATTTMLKNQVEEKKYVDIGVGAERHMNVSSTKLKNAVARLQDEGYTVHHLKIDQLGTSHQTTLKVLAGPDVQWPEVNANRDQIKQIANFSDDGGLTYSTNQKPISVNPNRVSVRYGSEGGVAADGVIYVRRGVDDVSLGPSSYAQVRVVVDGSHYLKGMAVYNDDMPAGVDLVFNTNKEKTGNKLDAMKEIKSDDPLDPFGSSFRQLKQLDAHGNEIPNTVRSAMNIVNEEGKWDTWSPSLSSQMLSKQSPLLAKTQLERAYERKQFELDDIRKTDNPAVKKRLLQSFADDADSSAVHLKAAALPRQRTQVILPLSTIRENEIYAPNFKNGEQVALIRHPHGGIFEIPNLTVNNRNPEGIRLLGRSPKDAVGIHAKTAEKLSGADFDGDTVLVIPNTDGKVKHSPALDELKNFDPKTSYPGYEGMPVMTPRVKGIEMGKISNLITDMHIRGANNAELARAVRHSMVVIDAEKHKLNYRQSAIDHGISALKKRYQDKNGGASTLISNSGTSSTTRIRERKDRLAKNGGPIDPATGKRMYEETGNSYVQKEDKLDKNGKVLVKAGTVVHLTSEVTKLGNVDDAHTLSSGTPIEKIYADHSNKMKALANEARIEFLETKSAPWSTEAKLKYANEVQSLDAKLNLALRNAPLERQAHILGNAQVAAKRAANPDMDSAELKKLKAQALEVARVRTGARKQQIMITDEEWAAIQAGAISTKKLNDILSNANLERIKELATPKTVVVMTARKKASAIQMLSNGKYTQAEVAAALGVSVTTLKRSLSEPED